MLATGTNQAAANQTPNKHSERFPEVDKTEIAIQEAMQSVSVKVDKTDASMSEFKAEAQRMQALATEMQDKLRCLSIHGPTTSMSGGAAGQSAGRAAQEATGSNTSNLRADEQPGQPSASNSGQASLATTQRLCGHHRWRRGAALPSDDDRRTVLSRRMPGQVMRSKLPELFKPVLDLTGDRFERFAGKPAVAAAVLVLKTEDDAASVVRELAHEPVAATFEEGKDPVPLWVTFSSPLQLRKLNGFTMSVKEVLQRDPHVKEVTTKFRTEGSNKLAEVLVQVGGSFIFRRSATVNYVDHGEDHCTRTCADAEVSYECLDGQLRAVMDLPPIHPERRQREREA